MVSENVRGTLLYWYTFKASAATPCNSAKLVESGFNGLDKYVLSLSYMDSRSSAEAIRVGEYSVANLVLGQWTYWVL